MIAYVKENKFTVGIVAIIAAILINVVFSAFADKPVPKVDKEAERRANIAVQDLNRERIVTQATDKISMLQWCMGEMAKENGTETVSVPCEQRIRQVTSTGATTNTGTGATPSASEQEKPQA